jgi:hypothetical protein
MFLRNETRFTVAIQGGLCCLILVKRLFNVEISKVRLRKDQSMILDVVNIASLNSSLMTVKYTQ